MTNSLVTYSFDGQVALVGLNRTGKRNAISNAMIEELRAAILRAHEEAEVGVIFGHGENFSAGLDLTEALARVADQGTAPRRRTAHPWHVTFDLIERGPIPWVSALQGAVIGGGLELAMATHVRVAEEGAYFGLPEGQRGIFVGGGGTVRIQRVVGTTVMMDMMLTGRLLSTAESERERIVRYVVPVGESLTKATQLAQRIAQNTNDTNWRIINILPRVHDLSHDDGLFMENMCTQMPKDGGATDRLREFLSHRAQPLAGTLLGPTS